MRDVPLVSVVECDETAEVTEAFARAVSLCKADDIVTGGEAVLVKPNLHGSEGHTAEAVMEAACRWALEHRAGEVLLADGPYWALKEPRSYLERCGLFRVAERLGIRAANLHDEPFVKARDPSPHLPRGLRLSRPALDCDVLVNLPVMKTHFNALVSLGTKNLKGCVHPDDKRRIHAMELNHGVAELPPLFRPALTVIDATTAMEGMGPSAGALLRMNLLIASRDVVTADAVACDLMGIAPEEVLHLRLAAEAGLGVSDLSAIKVVGADPDQHRRRFERPFEALAQQVRDIEVRTERACSGCTMNILGALRALAGESERLPYDLVFAGLGEPPAGALLVGDCTRRYHAHHDSVPGCPPSVEAIGEALRTSRRSHT